MRRDALLDELVLAPRAYPDVQHLQSGGELQHFERQGFGAPFHGGEPIVARAEAVVQAQHILRRQRIVDHFWR